MKKKFLILSLIMVFVMSFLSITVSANDFSFTASMYASNSKVAAGSEVLITVKVSNLDVGDGGINSFTAYLSYDTDIFETLTDSSIDGINGWVPNYTVGTGKVTLYRQTFLKTDEEIMQISLKTKSDVADGKTGDVKLSTIIVSNSSDEIMTSPVSTTITIGNDSSEDNINPNQNQTVTPPVTITPSTNVIPRVTTNNTVPTTNTPSARINANNTVNTENINNIQNNTEISNESAENIPYTGTDANALARIIIGIIFIGLVMYIKIERMNKDIR